MTLVPGTFLGQYEVLGHIGSGGMGEVYRARDSKLNREVAIKVLPEHFARDPERILRFRREAQLLASLNHPNIALIYNFEETATERFLVMEYVTGPSLAERIKRGPLPLEEALAIAKQIAAALEHAHEKPIIHRDLKPANLKVTPEGQLKVLDFGLAKAFAGAGQPPDPNDIPTGSLQGTLAGTILGTPAYMSPEQASGKPTDKRTDIWAFGCVLFELLTGRRAFPGETVTEIIAAVLRGEPDWTALPENVPPSIRVLLRRCLQKDSAERFRDAADIRIQIQEAASDSQTAAPIVVPSRPALPRRRAWILSFATLMIGAAVAGIAAWMLKPSPPQPVSRLTITLPPGQRLAALDQPAIAISPDGKNLVYVAIQSRDRERAAPNDATTEVQQLYLRPLDSMESKPIAGTEGAVAPFFSPDSQWIGFFAEGKLKKVSITGGAAVNLADAPGPGGAAWSSLGTLAYQGVAAFIALQQVSQEGGAPQSPIAQEGAASQQRWPEFLPGGRAIFFVESATTVAWHNAQIVVRPAETRERKNLVKGASQPRYAASGHFLYAQNGTLMAAPFDPRGLAVTGPSIPAVEGVMQSMSTGAAQYSVSTTGTLAYLGGGISSSQSRLVWVSRNAEERILPAAPHTYAYPRISPDGSRVAVSITEQETQTWIYDPSRDTLTRFTFDGNVNAVPSWSPDGRRIAFQSNKAGLGQAGNLFWQPADGSGTAEQLTTGEYNESPNSFSPDGKLIAFVTQSPQTLRDIWVLSLADKKAHPFLKTPFEETAPKFSPDGKWLAYSSNESGRREIYVQPYPSPGGKWQISTDGGQEPVWNPNGRELFYRSGSRIMAVDIRAATVSERPNPEGNPAFSAGKPHMLFEGPYLPTPASFPFYDVSPDGQRFLMLKPVDSQTSAPTQINVVLNWFEELKQRVPSEQ